MNYVPLRSSHPTWLTMQLPSDAVEILKFRPPSARSPADGTGSITFVARGPGIARAIATHLSREAIAVESIHERLLASARPGNRHLFSLPTALLAHLAIHVSVRGPRAGKGTDDQILWFLPSEEYYSYRQAESEGSVWHGPSLGESGHLYLAKASLPLPRALAALDSAEVEIEGVEWKAATDAFHPPGRARKTADAR